MLRNLLTPEAHRDPYVWAAVFVAHFGIGAMILIVAETLLSGIRAEHFDVIQIAFGAVFPPRRYRRKQPACPVAYRPDLLAGCGRSRRGTCRNHGVFGLEGPGINS